MKEDLISVAYGRFQCLVALERFHCLVTNGRRTRSILFTFFHFPFNKFYLNFFFSIDLKVLLYHGSKPLLMPFLPIPWPINYNHASQCNKSSTHPLSIWLWSKIYFPFLEFMASRMTTSYRLQVAQVNEKLPSGVILRFDVDATFWWWRSRIVRNAPSSWNWTPLSLVLSHFSELPHLGDFVTSRPCFWWWTWNCLRRFLQNWKHFHLRMVFNSRCWTLSLVA